jgi:ribonuclease R
MKKAVYAPKNIGHFGLSLEDYSQFTSPIRRFSDLQLHYFVKKYIKGEEVIAEDLKETCEHISMTEREADAAERESDKVKIARYVESKFDEYQTPHEGTVIGMNQYGLTVRVEDTWNGKVNYEEHFRYHKNDKKVTSKKTGNTYKIADKVYVLLKEVSIKDRFILLNINGEEPVEYEPTKVLKRN